jgi:hypothetical protein
MKLLIGSKYFFNKIENFIPGDEDYIELVPQLHPECIQYRGQGMCYFK